MLYEHTVSRSLWRVGKLLCSIAKVASIAHVRWYECRRFEPEAEGESGALSAHPIGEIMRGGHTQSRPALPSSGRLMAPPSSIVGPTQTRRRGILEAI